MNVQDKTFLTTEEFASAVRVRGTSVRSALCRGGSYLGVTPTKAKNGRLLWPESAVSELLGTAAPMPLASCDNRE